MWIYMVIMIWNHPYHEDFATQLVLFLLLLTPTFRRGLNESKRSIRHLMSNYVQSDKTENSCFFSLWQPVAQWGVFMANWGSGNFFFSQFKDKLHWSVTVSFCAKHDPFSFFWNDRLWKSRGNQVLIEVNIQTVPVHWWGENVSHALFHSLSNGNHMSDISNSQRKIRHNAAFTPLNYSNKGFFPIPHLN